MPNPIQYYKTSPEIIRLAVMMYVRFPLSLRQVEDMLHERGIDINYETVRAWQRIKFTLAWINSTGETCTISRRKVTTISVVVDC